MTTVTPNKRNTSFREGVMLVTRLYIEPSALVSRSLIGLELVTNFSFHTYLYLLFIRDYQTHNILHNKWFNGENKTALAVLFSPLNHLLCRG